MGWHSEAVFVPAPVVLRAVSDCMCGALEQVTPGETPPDYNT